MPKIDLESRSFISRNFNAMSDKEMAEILGKSVDVVAYLRRDMGLKRGIAPKKVEIIDGHVQCGICKEVKPSEAFITRKLGDRVKTRGSCKKCINSRSVSRAQKLRNLVFNHYGWVCVCCGDNHKECMTLDHIDNDGNKDKFPGGSKRTGKSLYSLVVGRNYPDGFQPLCHNCNFGKAAYGVCPHKRKF